MKKLLSAFAASILLLPLAAQASNTYGGIQYAMGSYNQDNFGEVNPTALIARFGSYVNNNVSIEGRLGIGLQDDSVNFLGTNISIELDALLGVYGAAHASINQNSDVYALIGFSRAEATVSALGYSASSDDTGLSFGVGANLGVGNNVSLNIEYVQYLNKSDFDFSALAFGAVFGF